MNTRNVKLIVAVAVAACVGHSCQKYEDGPFFSLKSKKARLAHTWDIVEARDDGEDVSERFDQYELSLYEDGAANLKAEYHWGGFTFSSETDGTWRLVDDKELLDLDFENDNADKRYQILRLTDEELWLRQTGDDLQLHLEAR